MGIGYPVGVMFSDSFMDDFIYVRDAEFCMLSMICYIPRCICYGSKNCGPGSLHDDYVMPYKISDICTYNFLP
jgi:hypothetical protein